MARWAGLAARQARKVIGEIYEIATREPLPSYALADYRSLGPKGSKSHGPKTATRYFGHR